MKYLIASILLITISFSSLKAETNITGGNNPIETLVPFLTIATDASATGMGDIGAASLPDVYSQYWNAAKYNFIDSKFGGALSYTPWLRKLQIDDINLISVIGYYKLDEEQTLSGSIKYFDLGEIIGRNNQGGETGTIHPNEWAIDAAYGRKLGENFGAALTFRFILSDIAGGVGSLDATSASANYQKGKSYAADINTYYQKDVEMFGYSGQYAFGAQVSNIGAKMTYSDDGDKNFIPTNLRLGGRMTVDIDEYNKVSAMVDFNKLLVPTPDTISKKSDVSTMSGIFQSFNDAPGGMSEELREIMWSLGIEYWYLNQIAIRAGYFNEHETKGDRKYYTAGAGIKFNSLTFDLSYLIAAEGGNHPLANTIRFSLGFQFNE